MNLITRLNNYCDENLTLYGYANIREYSDFIYLNKLRKYPNTISIGIKIPDEVLDNLNNLESEIEYKNTYDYLNKKLNKASSDIVKIIQEYDYHAECVNSSYILPESNLHGEISHKFAANLAGLGWIGKSCLFITPQYGPRLRWATILTDAPLPTSNKEMEQRCDDCNMCVTACPANAFKDVTFNKADPREKRYDAVACSKYFDKLEKEGRPRLCGICVKVCPWGLQKNK